MYETDPKLLSFVQMHVHVHCMVKNKLRGILVSLYNLTIVVFFKQSLYYLESQPVQIISKVKPPFVTTSLT